MHKFGGNETGLPGTRELKYSSPWAMQSEEHKLEDCGAAERNGREGGRTEWMVKRTLLEEGDLEDLRRANAQKSLHQLRCLSVLGEKSCYHVNPDM